MYDMNIWSWCIFLRGFKCLMLLGQKPTSSEAISLVLKQHFLWMRCSVTAYSSYCSEIFAIIPVRINMWAKFYKYHAILEISVLYDLKNRQNARQLKHSPVFRTLSVQNITCNKRSWQLEKQCYVFYSLFAHYEQKEQNAE